MSNLLEERIYKCVIVDDDDMDRITLSHYLKDFRNLEHLASFSAPHNCLAFLEHNKVDILFLDVKMPKMNGLQLLNKVKSKIECAVLTTLHLEYNQAAEGLENYHAGDSIKYIINDNRPLDNSTGIGRTDWTPLVRLYI